VEGAQGGEDDDQAALHVVDAGANDLGALAGELLEGAGGLEDGVEMADQEHAAAARADALGDEMAPALEGALVHNSGLEAEALELGFQQLGHLADAGGVEGAAVDVDEALEQGGVGVPGGLDGGGDLVFLRGQGEGKDEPGEHIQSR